MKLVNLIHFDIQGDSRGSLVSLEQHKNIPFEVLRVYYIFDTESGVSRGYHAHSNLEQVVISIRGSCRFVLDDGHVREEVWLSSPQQGLYIGNNIWREMHDFSEDCLLIVLASDYYHEKDYVRNYSEFLSMVNNDDS